MTGYFVYLATNECFNPCPDGYFGNASSGNCEECDASCSTCVTSSTNCLSCASQMYPSSASFPSICSSCDAACDECTAAGHTACQACSANYYLVELTSTCVAACSDYAPYYFLDGATCKQCAAECATCSGFLNSNCLSCASSHYEVVGHPSASPLLCLPACPLFYFQDASQCKGKSLLYLSLSLSLLTMQ